ncbi:hypothetical protein [Haloferax volcanii]|jgi:hypothetical protein|uniref:Uncharacterized protein n=3 Tax=Haloferax volcanii TaxID=2246 RepID=A0A384LFZ3_HALVD|nr:hypothetical protein [Haloferax volcanii]AOP12797.1 uncharacterized protein HVO_B0234B [Haloferax volcanii DS2]ELY36972.1 hypothetical protein C498_02460 [Haloferax volcanii DS2]MBS8117950.1 hypothetical protein [Haloferax volcanii]MBS8122962.1 hypothetical protein [Haloferax volcanii]MBS8126830.1 hypothetical protein [Haloferax volcanii]
MELRKLVSDYLPNAVVAATIFTIYNTYTGDTADPVTIGVEFIFSIIAIFIGFIVITPILNKTFDIVRR